MLKRPLRLVLIIFRLAYGFAIYRSSHRTPYSSYIAMRQLFCITSGYGLDFLGFLVRVKKRSRGKRFVNAQSYIDHSKAIRDSRGVEFVSRELKQKGFCVLDTLVDQQILDDILHFGLTSAAHVLGSEIKTAYNRDKPVGVRYDFTPNDILANTIFNSLLSSQFTLEVAATYLGCRPWLDVISLWWHTSYSKKPDADAAQLYHFDLDRIKWLKVFIYITDVGPNNGPHCYIEGSHKSGILPQNFRESIASRLEDHEVFSVFPKEKEKKFIGPRGTVIIEDTRGLHKGQHVESGDRLIFQIQYSNSLFGMDYEPIQRNAVNTGLLVSLDRMHLNFARS